MTCLLRLMCGAELGHLVPSRGHLRAWLMCSPSSVSGQLLSLLLGPADQLLIRKVSLAAELWAGPVCQALSVDVW